MKLPTEMILRSIRDLTAAIGIIFGGFFMLVGMAFGESWFFVTVK